MMYILLNYNCSLQVIKDYVQWRLTISLETNIKLHIKPYYHLSEFSKVVA